jgi:hypothetical protein
MTRGWRGGRPEKHRHHFLLREGVWRCEKCPAIRKPLKRGKRPRRERKSTIAELKRKLDKIVGAEVRSLGMCQGGAVTQGCKGPLQWAHGFSRRYLGTRWDLRNGLCLCAAHHLYFTHRPAEWEMWLQRYYGMTEYLALQAKALQITHVTRDDLERRLAELSAVGGI